MRVILGLALLGVVAAGCGGSTDDPAADRQPQAGVGAFICDDGAGDVKVAGVKRPAPKFTDLKRVTWRRTATSAIVDFETAAPLPAKLPKTKKQWGQVTFSVFFQQAAAKTLVHARLEGTRWKVANGKEPLAATAAVENGKLVLTLPQDLIVPAGAIDLGAEVVVGAKVTAQAKAKGKLTAFADADCRVGQAAPTRIWPVPEDDDDSAKLKKPKSKKKRR